MPTMAGRDFNNSSGQMLEVHPTLVALQFEHGNEAVEFVLFTVVMLIWPKSAAVNVVVAFAVEFSCAGTSGIKLISDASIVTSARCRT